MTHHLVHLGCWAHCRRYVFDALQALPKSSRTPDQLAAKLMALIGLLYKAESQANEQKLDAAAIKALRQEHSVLVSDPLHMKRAIAMATDLGLHALPAPTLSSRFSSWTTWGKFLWRETWLYIHYEAFGPGLQTAPEVSPRPEGQDDRI